MLKLTTEQRAVLNRAAHIYSEASGMPPAAAVEQLLNDPAQLAAIIDGLSVMAGGASPLADELMALIPVEEKPAPASPLDTITGVVPSPANAEPVAPPAEAAASESPPAAEPVIATPPKPLPAEATAPAAKETPTK